VRARIGIRVASVTAAATIACGPAVEEELTHGTVQLEFHRSQSEADGLPPHLDYLEVTMTYLECLSALYDERPELRQDDPNGALIFASTFDGGEGWPDRLCPTEVAAQLDCEVTEFHQELVTARELTVTYALFEANADLEGGHLSFGPLPTARLAQCEAGLEPSVRLTSIRIPDGSALWQPDASSPIDAATNQALPIAVTIGGV
jgi:hypothetical protein